MGNFSDSINHLQDNIQNAETSGRKVEEGKKVADDSNERTKSNIEESP